MNPLIVFFFTAIGLEDYLFRDGFLIKYLIYSVIAYWIFYCFVQKSETHSPSRKLLLASYSQSYDPTIYVKVKFDIAKVKIFLEELEKKIGKKVNLTLFFVKACADLFKKYPEFNQAIKYGLHQNKKTVDFSVLVDVGGKVKFSLF
jgi:hypothetical protein